MKRTFLLLVILMIFIISACVDNTSTESENPSDTELKQKVTTTPSKIYADSKCNTNTGSAKNHCVKIVIDETCGHLFNKGVDRNGITPTAHEMNECIEDNISSENYPHWYPSKTN